MLTVAQDQALPARWRKKHIEKQIETSMCRLCGKEETAFHILCECSKIAATEYNKRHDGVASIVHWNLTPQYRFKATKEWYGYQTETVLENQKKTKILWGMSIKTNHVIQARRPDIAVKDMKLDHTWRTDIAVPGDERVKDNKKGKSGKVSRFGDRTEKNLEYICDSCSLCGWNARSSMQVS